MSTKSNGINIIPNGYTAVTPWIISQSTEKTIAFLEAVFDAKEVSNSKIINENGVVIHAVVKVGDAMLMLFDSNESWGPTPSYLNFYVKDVEKAYSEALKLGAVSVTDITTLWFGERVCRILDPFGNLFWINERIEELDFTSPENAQRAATVEAIKGITYIQETLHNALKTQKEFFKSNS